MLTLQWCLDVPDPPADCWEATAWSTLQTTAIPLTRPVLIQLRPMNPGLAAALMRLVDRLKMLLQKMAGGDSSQPHSGDPLLSIPPGATAGQRLEVLIGDGQQPLRLDAALQTSLQAYLNGDPQQGMLACLPDTHQPLHTILPEDLLKLNLCFWPSGGIDELAITILARAGVTSLQRRVFISYRRIDTEPLAQQLFDALTRRNYDVFLDTVSLDPGVYFQEQLMQKLADKSMVLILHSKGFLQSSWTRAEIDFAIQNELSLLSLRLPDLADSEQLRGTRDGDKLPLKQTDFEAPHQAQMPQASQLTAAALQQVVRQITEIHDLEMVGRLVKIRQRILEQVNGQTWRRVALSSSDASIQLLDAVGISHSLVPVGRPPGFQDVYEASVNQALAATVKRVVVGRCANLPQQRRQQLQWACQGRNVDFWDVAMLAKHLAALDPEPGPEAPGPASLVNCDLTPEPQR